MTKDMTTYISTDHILDELELKIRGTGNKLSERDASVNDLSFYGGKLAAYMEICQILRNYKRDMLKTGTDEK